VNSAAVFRDAWADVVPAAGITGLITASIAVAVTGCATAVRRFLAAGSGGAIVSVSSRQARGLSAAHSRTRPRRPRSRA
jgi:hypothetical protein